MSKYTIKKYKNRWGLLCYKLVQPPPAPPVLFGGSARCLAEYCVREGIMPANPQALGIEWPRAQKNLSVNHLSDCGSTGALPPPCLLFPEN